MRSTPPILALGLVASLSSCSTWPPRHVPEPTPSVAQPSREFGETVVDADVAGAVSAPALHKEETSSAEAVTAAIQGVQPSHAATAQEPPPTPAQEAPAVEPTAQQPGDGGAANAADLTATGADAEDQAVVAHAPTHPLGARGSHISGAELFGVDVAGADGGMLGRLFDLHVRPDGTLDCLVLVGPNGLRVYTGIDLALDEQGGVRLASGTRCEPNDPLNDGAPYRELFVGRQTSTLVGQLTAVEARDGSNPPVTVIKLRAANNHHHRVLVGPTAFLAERELALIVDQEVAIDGIETRDSKGKLWVAGALRSGGRELRLRAGNGEPAWDPTQLPLRQDGCCRDIDGSLLSTFELGRWRVRIQGAPELMPCDLVFDRSLEVSFLVVHHEGRERLVPWSATSLEPGLTLALQVGEAVIATAPTLPEVTADDYDPWQTVRDWWSFAARPVEAAAAPAAPVEQADQADQAEPHEPAAQTPEAGGAPQTDAQPPSGAGNGLEPSNGAQR